MSLLLKSLQRIDSRPRAPVPEAEEAIIGMPLDLLHDATTAVVESEIDAPLEAIAEAVAAGDESTIVEETVADVLDPIEPDGQPLESIPPDALFPPPIEQVHREPAPSDTAIQIQAKPPLAASLKLSEPPVLLSPVISELDLNLQSPLEEISALEELLTAEISSVEPAPVILPTVEPALETLPPGEAHTLSPLPLPSLVTRPLPLTLSDEYRELRDHFLARCPLESHSSLLLIDAGRAVTDVSWAVPFVASLLDHLNQQRETAAMSARAKLDGKFAGPARALLIEAAGTSCGLGRSFGIDVKIGLGEVLRGEIGWQAAVQPTVDPQIHVLGRGIAPLSSDFARDLAALWSELKVKFDLLVLPVGPLAGVFNNQASDSVPTSFLPLGDAAILCLEIDGTPQSLALDAKRMLEDRGVNLLGCIVRGETAAA